MKKVVIVNCFDTYEDRIDLLHAFFTNKGHDVTIIQSDFRHFKKIHRKEVKQDYIFVKSKPYFKNMSFARLSSHYNYAKNAFKHVEELKPDLLYVVVPPNSLAKFAALYKKKYKGVKLIFDLIDLWPETMPVGKIKTLPPFTFWKQLRDKGLNVADFVITECTLYQSILSDALECIETETVYLAKNETNANVYHDLSDDLINLCYLGSINNIIDIPKIKEIVNSINNYKPTTLHIIGDGESRDILIEEIKATGANVKYHGKIYDPYQKQEIFNKCHFGLNIMKETVCVGLTMKSIDYFQSGLPILNNIKADTTEIIDDYKVGFNITDSNIDEISRKIIDSDKEELISMRHNAQRIFHELFSTRAFEEKMNNVMKRIEK